MGTLKGSLYPKIAACHISGNTLNILTKFCTYLVYVKSTLFVKFEFIWICVAMATNILKSCVNANFIQIF